MGEPSPYFGVLVNPDRYRVYTIGHLEAKQVQKELDIYLANPPAPDVEIHDSVGALIGWFGLGVIIGLTAGVMIH